MVHKSYTKSMHVSHTPLWTNPEGNFVLQSKPPQKMSLKGNYRETDRSSKSWFTVQWLWTRTRKLGAWNSFPISHGAEGPKHHLQLPSQAH